VSRTGYRCDLGEGEEAVSLFPGLDARIKRFGVLDVKLAQGAAIFLALTIVKLFPQIMNLSVWWFVGLCVLCALRPVALFFGGGESV
jgi:hypothetical protein